MAFQRKGGNDSRGKGDHRNKPKHHRFRNDEDRKPYQQHTAGRQSSNAPTAREDQFYAVGRRAALEFLQDEEKRTKIEKVYIAHGAQGPQIGEILHYARKYKIAISEIDRGKFKDLEKRIHSNADAQGVVLLIAQRQYEELEDVIERVQGKDPLLLIALDGVEDPHNIGAVIRSAEAAGAHAILLPKRGAVLTPAVFKTSAGAAAHMPIVKYGNLEQTIRKMREEYGIQCIGLAGEGEHTLYDVDLTSPLCIITGSEEKGLSRLVRERCDELVRIPMHGKTASLNASVASAIALFETGRQRATPKA